MKPRNETRRPSLATIVGSSLAVVAAGSLLAFSSLAEQAGLQGLATGGLQPAHPARAGGGRQAITIPAPATAPPRDPRESLTDLVREMTIAPSEAPVVVTETFAFAPTTSPAQRPEQPERKMQRPKRIEARARVALAGPMADDREAADWGGPPYGHAYGHDKKKHDRSNPAGTSKPGKGRSRTPSPQQPVDAGAADGRAKAPKPKKAKHASSDGHGKAKSHSKHRGAHANGKSESKGKAKGHSKHGG